MNSNETRKWNLLKKRIAEYELHYVGPIIIHLDSNCDVKHKKFTEFEQELLIKGWKIETLQEKVITYNRKTLILMLSSQEISKERT